MFPLTEQGLLTKQYEVLTDILTDWFERYTKKHSSD
jgi:hypothetical protein